MKTTKSKPTLPFLESALAKFVDDDSYFSAKGPLPATLHHGQGRTIVATGDNASGKSFFGKWLCALHQHRHKEDETQGDHFIVGMSSRTMAGMHRVFMYGDEQDQSTGDTTVKSVKAALKTSRNREIPHLVVLDEPDLGLSEDYASAMGRLIADHACDLPALCDGLVVITHSRALAKAFLPLDVHHVGFGGGRTVVPTLKEWIDRGPQDRSVEDLLAIHEVGVERWRAIQNQIDQNVRTRAGRKSSG